jgi:hypothetical protein
VFKEYKVFRGLKDWLGLKETSGIQDLRVRKVTRVIRAAD